MAHSWGDSFGAGLLSLLESGAETDFVLSCTDGNVRCHRVILMAHGGLLAQQVKERLADNVSRLDISRLHVSQETGMLILQTLYGGLKEQFTVNNATQFLHFAHHFEIKWLENQLNEKFSTVLSPQNVLKLHKRPEVQSSSHLMELVQKYCSNNFLLMVDQCDLSLASLSGVKMLLAEAKKHENFDCLKLFTNAVKWLLANNENIKSAGVLLEALPLKTIEMTQLQNEVYDTIFNLLIIGRGDVLTQEDKVKLSSLYQEAVRDSPQSPDRVDSKSNKLDFVKVEIFEVDKKDVGKVGLQDDPTRKADEAQKDTITTKSGILNGREELDGVDEKRRQWSGENSAAPVKWEVPVPGKESIISHIQSGEWTNMEFEAVKSIIRHEHLEETEFVAVESILLWIAADHYRKQHCESLLRSCRFSDVCPVYVRSVLTTFVTEKMVGSARLANNILRSPSTPRQGSVAPGRLAGVVDEVPLSVQRLQLGEHHLTAKCATCGARCQVLLRVSRALPTAVVSQIPCIGCGLQRVIHTACASTLTPDVFPSMHLLPFHHLAKQFSSMDDMRIYLFKLHNS